SRSIARELASDGLRSLVQPRFTGILRRARFGACCIRGSGRDYFGGNSQTFAEKPGVAPHEDGSLASHRRQDVVPFGTGKLAKPILHPSGSTSTSQRVTEEDPAHSQDGALP